MSILFCSKNSKGANKLENLNINELENITPIIETVDTSVCVICKYRALREDNLTGYCEACREDLLKRPFPLGIKIMAMGLGLLVAVSAYRYPVSVNQLVTYNNGIESFKAHEMDKATVNFEKLAKDYPESTEINAWLYLSYCYHMDYDKADVIFAKLPKSMEGLSTELNTEIDTFNDLTDSTGGHK
jgi:TolA-binding protein